VITLVFGIAHNVPWLNDVGWSVPAEANVPQAEAQRSGAFSKY